MPQHLKATDGPKVLSFGGIEADGDGASAEATIAGPEARAVPDPAGVWAAVCDTLADSRERQVVWMRYGLGATLDQIGAAIGVSKERVRQLVDRAVGRLRERGERFAEWRGEDAA